MTDSKRSRPLSGAVLAALAAAAPLAAQETMENVVVTGTRLPEAQQVSVVTLDREAIERSGATSLRDLTRDLVLSSAGLVDEQFTQGFAPASAGIDLRGLGVNRTLVLLNGRRLPIFPFGQNGNESFVDINTIPLSAIERVEIQTGGASAIYGADAVAGVVNIITHDLTEPTTRLSGRFSNTSEGDGEEAYFTALAGTKLGESTFTFSFEYLDRNPIMARDRDISASANGATDDRSNAGNPGTFITSMGPVPDEDCPPELIRGPFCTFDFAQDVTLVPGVERIGTYLAWDHSLSDSVSLFSQITYNNSRSERDLAAAPNGYPVAADNPNNIFGEDILAVYRTTEFGPRRDAFETNALNLVAGANGSAGRWTWEAAGGYSIVDTSIRGVNGYALTADVQAAIDSGELNVFGDSPDLDVDALRYVTARDGESTLAYLQFNSTADLLDMRHGALAGAFGVEFRQEDFSDSFDDRTTAGEVIGVGGVSADGDRDVFAAYVELAIPVAARLDLQVAGRFDQYSDFGGTFNPKLGLNWQPVNSLTVRAAASTGFKAPALHELYSGDITAFDSVFDTTRCEQAQADGDADAIDSFCGGVSQVMFTAIGNPDLDAEESNHLSAGFDWAPIERLGLTVDYWWLENRNAVTASPQFYVDNEAQFAGNVVRDGNGNITMISSPYQNIAEQQLWGIDARTNLRLGEGDFGRFDLTAGASYLGNFDQQAFVGDLGESLAGNNGVPEWRAQSALVWARNSYDASVAVQYVGGYERTNAEESIDSWTTVDLRFGWAPRALAGGSVAFGVDNAFDEAPPLDPLLSGFPFFNQALHDPRGRFFYLRYSHEL